MWQIGLKKTNHCYGRSNEKRQQIKICKTTKTNGNNWQYKNNGKNRTRQNKNEIQKTISSNLTHLYQNWLLPLVVWCCFLNVNTSNWRSFDLNKNKKSFENNNKQITIKSNFKIQIPSKKTETFNKKKRKMYCVRISRRFEK